MKYKIILPILAILISTSIFFQVFSQSFAAPKKPNCPRNRVFLCQEDVELIVYQTFQPLVDIVADVAGKQGETDRKIASLEARLAMLEKQQSPTSAPTASPTPTNSPVAFDVDFSVVDEVDKPVKLTATANKAIEKCAYQLKNGGISTNGTGVITNNTCVVTATAPMTIQYVRVESFQGEVKIYGTIPSNNTNTQ